MEPDGGYEGRAHDYTQSADDLDCGAQRDGEQEATITKLCQLTSRRPRVWVRCPQLRWRHSRRLAVAPRTYRHAPALLDALPILCRGSGCRHAEPRHRGHILGLDLPQ